MPALSKFHLCPAVGERKAWTPALSGLLSTSRGFSRLRRSMIENLPLLLSPAE
jgi:hypothetical protein